MGRSRGLLLIRALLSAAFGAASLEFAASSAIAQTIVEYPVSGLSIWSWQKSAIAPGPDGALWFAQGNGIGRITTDGVITEFHLPNARSIAGVAAGPDGNIWFTEPTENRIGFFSTSGKFKEFEIPYQCSGVGCSWGAVFPNGIVAGPDGDLWFTEYNLGRIGRISTAGVMKHFQIRTSTNRSHPTCITAGPDGALWFSEDFGIGRITTDGAITEFQIPSGLAASCITAGPDGALWYTGNHRIGRIDASGAVTEFFISGAWNGITAGPDGNLWFIINEPTRQYQIGRITTDGVLTRFRIPNADTAYLVGITAGPDGAVWFTQYNPYSIVRIAAYLDRVPPAPETDDRRPIIVPFR